MQTITHAKHGEVLTLRAELRLGRLILPTLRQEQCTRITLRSTDETSDPIDDMTGQTHPWLLISQTQMRVVQGISEAPIFDIHAWFHSTLLYQLIDLPTSDRTPRTWRRCCEIDFFAGEFHVACFRTAYGGTATIISCVGGQWKR